jgi:hypothetical protein
MTDDLRKANLTLATVIGNVISVVARREINQLPVLCGKTTITVSIKRYDSVTIQEDSVNSLAKSISEYIFIERLFVNERVYLQFN